MKNLLKRGINIDVLKTIALIAMVIDHVAFYFNSYIPNTAYIICRCIGRISMPIFTFSLVQGFFHTSNFKKYITRVSIAAVITQVLITILAVINKKYVPLYIDATWVYTHGNILFTFAICLVTMKIIHEDILIKKWDYSKNISLKVILILCILIICIFVPLDYGIETLILCILMYLLERLRIMLLIEKSKGSKSIKGVALNYLSEDKIQIIYIVLIFMTLLLLFMYFPTFPTMLLSIVPIALYNYEKGKNNKFVKRMYYYIFPIHHVLLYLAAIILFKRRF